MPKIYPADQPPFVPSPSAIRVVVALGSYADNPTGGRLEERAVGDALVRLLEAQDPSQVAAYRVAVRVPYHWMRRRTGEEWGGSWILEPLQSYEAPTIASVHVWLGRGYMPTEPRLIGEPIADLRYHTSTLARLIEEEKNAAPSA